MERQDWDLVTPRTWQAMCRLADKCARGDPHLRDELLGEFVDRMPRLMEIWDPERDTSFWAYAHRSLKWYAYKYVRRVARMACTEFVDQQRPQMCRVSTEVALEVQLLVERLDDYSADLLVQRYALEYTWDEMARIHGRSVNKIRKDTAQALDDAKAALHAS